MQLPDQTRLFRRLPACTLAALGLLLLLLPACSPQPTPPPVATDDPLATIVAQTLAALTEQAPPTLEATFTPTFTPYVTETPTSTPTVTPTATQIPDNVAGRVCYPGGDVPAMLAYFEDTEKETAIEVRIEPGQTEYKATLPPGSYIAYAWLEDFSRGGLYSRAIPCGLGSSCDDHTLLPFVVEVGKVLEGIDLCDWYAGPFGVPYPPGVDVSDLTGGISGSISFPGGSPPSFKVFAFNRNTFYWYWVRTLEGATSFSLNDLPAGTYHIVAYGSDGQVGAHANGTDLIEVLVRPGEVTGGVNINEWDAPASAFPPDPTR